MPPCLPLLLLFSFLFHIQQVAIGGATFLESIYGIQTAKIVVYNATWFTLLLIYLSFGLISNIIAYQMWQAKKIAVVDEHHLDKMMLPFISFLKRKLPSQRGHCIYLDRGDKELDASYPPYHKLLNEFISSRYKRHHFKSLVFNEQGHNEKDWSRRLEIPMCFLLK